MSSVIKSRGGTSIGQARVGGGSVGYINQAGASGRAAMQMGKALSNLGTNLNRVYGKVDKTLDKEQRLINLNQAKASYNSVLGAVNRAAVNGGVGPIQENGEPETPWLPTQYQENADQAFSLWNEDENTQSLIGSFDSTTKAAFDQWQSSQYNTTAGQVAKLGRQRRSTMQQSQRTVAAQSLFNSALSPSMEQSEKSFSEYRQSLVEGSQYGSPLTPAQINSNERSFATHYTLTSLFGGENPDNPSSGVTLEHYDSAITNLSNPQYMPVIEFDGIAIQGLSIEERTSVVNNLKERRSQKEIVNTRAIEKGNEFTAAALLDKGENLTQRDLAAAIEQNPRFIDTASKRHFQAKINRLNKTGATATEDVRAYRTANKNIMNGDVIKNLAQQYRQNPNGAIMAVRDYLTENVEGLSSTHYDGVPSILKDFFGKGAPLNKNIVRMDSTVENMLKLKFYAERSGEPLDLAGMTVSEVAIAVTSLSSQNERTKSEIAAQVALRMNDWDLYLESTLNADKSGSPWVDLVTPPSVRSDGTIVSGSENPKYIGKRMMDNFVSGESYQTQSNVQVPYQPIRAINAVDTVSERWNTGDTFIIEQQNGGQIKFRHPTLASTQEDTKSVYWNEIAVEMNGTEKKMIIFDDPGNAPVGWKNGREPISHITQRLK